jgi:MFS family permease
MDDNSKGWRNWPARLQAGFQGTFRSLQNRNFRIYCIGQLVSISGTWMQSMAMSWLIYKLTDSALMLGVVTFASMLPMLLFSYHAGVVADRFDRKKIILTTTCVALAQALVLTVLTAANLLTIPIVVLLAWVRLRPLK